MIKNYTISKDGKDVGNTFCSSTDDFEKSMRELGEHMRKNNLVGVYHVYLHTSDIKFGDTFKKIDVTIERDEYNQQKP